MSHNTKSRASRNTKIGMSAKMVQKTGRFNKIRLIQKRMFKYLVQSVGKPYEPIFKKIQYNIDSPKELNFFLSCIIDDSKDYFRWGDCYFSTISIVDGIIVINNPKLSPNDIQKECCGGYYWRGVSSFNGKKSNYVSPKSIKHLKKQWQLEDKIKVQLTIEHMIHDKQKRNLLKKTWNIPNIKVWVVEDDLVITNPHLE